MNGNRLIENSLAILGGAIAAAYVVFVEILPHSGMGSCHPPPTHAGFPWGVVILVSAMVAPKTLSRATAGRVWESLAGAARRTRRRLSGGHREP